MTSRFRLTLVAGVLVFAGCSDAFNAGPISYAKSEQYAIDLAGKPRLQAAVQKILADTYGPSPRSINVPKGAPLLNNGVYLADHYQVAGNPQVQSPSYFNSAKGRETKVEGGYALYRRHCLHCHGVTGDGAGPTADFLYPRPRDYRRGTFKFTSTTGTKPTRDDLRKTLLYGLPNTSMPAFEALMSPAEIEQVLDYTIFLSLRGETERQLINEASVHEESEAETVFNAETLDPILAQLFENWKTAPEQVLAPPVGRVEATSGSVARGKQLFLGKTTEKLECAGCHGAKAKGDGPSWIDVNTFNEYVFSSAGDRKKIDELKAIAEKANKKWGDDWGNPLRPNNLNLGIYKGGRRPIDLYWRIAKGINGTPMPAHASALKPEQIWDLVNFVLTLPYEPELLKDATAAPITPTAAPPAVAVR